VTPHSQSPPPRSGINALAAFLTLLLIAVVFRAPWFFQDVIDWDESVFIVAGNALAHGHLPYTLVWDNKPPLGFAFFAAAISIVPDSLAFIRFSGAVLVAAAAYLVFRISARLMDGVHAFLCAALFVPTVSVLITSGPSVMMEHVALVPMLGALALVSRPAPSRVDLSLAGALLAAAALTRLNLAYLPAAVCVYLFLAPRQTGLRRRIEPVAYLVLGSAALVAPVVLVYAVTGNAGLLIASAVKVPWAYSHSGDGLVVAADGLIRQALRWFPHIPRHDPGRVLNTVFWFGGFAGLVALLFRGRASVATAPFVLLFSAATLYSILSSGFVWAHHLIQLAPFFAIGLGLVLARLPVLGRPVVAGLAIAALATGFSLSKRAFYADLVESARGNRPVYTGETFDVARYLQSIVKPGDTLFVTHDTLLYWLMGDYPPIPVAAFPWNLWQEDTILKPLYGPEMTTEAAFDQIAAKAPTWIVVPTPERLTGFDGEPGHTVPQRILDDYSLQGTVSARLIYRREPG